MDNTLTREAARQFLNTESGKAMLYLDPIEDVLAAFHLQESNKEWTAIETAGDLPKKASEYLWRYRNGGYHVMYYDPTTTKDWQQEDFVRHSGWWILVPFTPQGESTPEKID